MKNKSLLMIAGLFGLSVLFSCTNPAREAANPVADANKAAMEKIYNAFNTGNVDELNGIVDENVVEHSPDPNIKTTGLAGLKEMITMYRSSFPDMNMKVMSMTVDGDKVITHFNMTGTNTGAMGESPATNKNINVNGVDICRFENGKVMEHWGYYEEMKMMDQLGLLGGQEAPAGMTEEKK